MRTGRSESVARALCQPERPMSDQSKTQESDQPSDADALPGWLRTRYADALRVAQASVTDEATRTGKLGRASCRERVGQYVTSSVVAGSLTKKTRRKEHRKRNNTTKEYTSQ